ncbi:MAG TPA: tetratricopeptide repeat protein [Polyangiaceae bacterium]|jgi:tetratricopeptide (TPR) repeat protein
MARARQEVAVTRAATPEALLRKATLAKTSGLRAKYAQRGLECRTGLDRTTRVMLLRQLYLSDMEKRLFGDALKVARDMIGLSVMPDVAHQDAARACLGLGDVENAVHHLRLAGRACPPSRRAFHLWTLGSALYLNGDYASAVGVLARAARWGTTDKPLYQAQAALARVAGGDAVADLRRARERLEDAPCGQGYGQFVLGELSYHLGDFAAARIYLRAFVKRSTGGRVALQVALAGEIARARGLLARLRTGQRSAR